MQNLANSTLGLASSLQKDYEERIKRTYFELKENLKK